MVKKKAKQANNSKNAKSRKSKLRREGKLGYGILSDPRVAAWDQLLRDPCSANLASPCYSGTDSGYLVRTVDIVAIPDITISTGTVGALYPADAVFSFTPFNVSSTTGILSSVALASSALGAVNASGVTNFVTTNSVVRRYRPVACCLKFIPTGPFSTRQGSVGLGYSSGMPFASGSANQPTINQALAECQRICPNGSAVHEVRWLPTAVDENFTDTPATNNTGAATVFMALKGIDAIGKSATAAAVAGYIELTTVYEWVPSYASGACPAPKAPLPYTSQQVLSTISDLGAYLFEGVRAGASGAMHGMIQAGTRAGFRLLTNGIGEIRSRGAGLPLLPYF